MTDDSVFHNEAETSPSLLSRARANDESAWQRLVGLYRPLIRIWSSCFGISENDYDNIEQEVFASVAKSLEGFDRRRTGSFRKWLKTITRNKCIDFLRSRPESSLTSEQLANLRDETATTPDSSESRETGILYDQVIAMICNNFSGRDLEMFRRVIADGVSPAQVAEEFQVTRNVVYLSTSRILKHLRDEFAGVIELARDSD